MRRRWTRITAAVVALSGALAVWVIANTVFPYHSLNHDEAVYLQQAAMLLEGQLTLRPPVEDVFRPWFFIDTGEYLYPKYAPVPAAIFAVGFAVGVPRLALAGIAAGILALTYGVTTEAFDRRTGLLAAVFVFASPLFLIDTSVFLPYAPTAFLNLAFAYAYLRGDRLESARWAALAGVAVGLAFFARPYTAVLFATPFVAHACYALWRDRDAISDLQLTSTVRRQVATGTFGLAGVSLALVYNAVLTGSASRFPYEAFAPLDGLGFGTRRILAHEVEYTLSLAVRANVEVVSTLLTGWVAGGLVGTGLTALGLGVAIRRGLTGRQAAIAGIFVTVILGNVYFWGNYNILGDIERAGDGLIAALGPYYHFDLLVPTAAFAARGTLAGVATLRHLAAEFFDPMAARAVVVVLLLVSASVFGVATAGTFSGPLDRNTEVTTTYEDAYEPFQERSLEDAAVLLPAPYGEWLNHPFQLLRNDPGFDGEVVYALDDRPFALADAYPGRTLYRYTIRGAWAPIDGSPEAARLAEIRDVSGSAVTLEAALGIPPGAQSVTVRLGTDDGSAYYVRENTSDPENGPNASDAQDPTGTLHLELQVVGDGVTLGGEVQDVGDTALGLGEDDTVRVTVFVDYGASGFSYRLDLPTRTEANGIRALSPRIEHCVSAQTCGGEAAYIPEQAPDDVFVRTNLSAVERNG
jgi:hypothetical protein